MASSLSVFYPDADLFILSYSVLAYSWSSVHQALPHKINCLSKQRGELFKLDNVAFHITIWTDGL
jgi:hypothetical protein